MRHTGLRKTLELNVLDTNHADAIFQMGPTGEDLLVPPHPDEITFWL